MKNETLKKSSINTKSDLNLNPNFTEFSYLSGYNLRISCENYIAISIYNLEALDGERYEITMNQLFLYKLSEKFKKLNAINNIYTYIVQLIKENNFRIINNPPNLTLALEIKEELDNIELIKINLITNNKKSGNSKYIQEYLTILINEIKRLRNTGDIETELKKENKNLKKEIEELKNMIKSNNTVNNKNLLNKISNNKDKISLDEFNKQFGLKLKNNQIRKLDLDGLKLGNEIIKSLSKVELKYLEKLYLGNNGISDIKMLEFCDYENLQKLSLVDNKISDINALEKVNFQYLKELYLYNNNITNIKPLENSDFNKLQILSLNNNKIFNINFSKLNFVELKELYFNNNNISNITTLAESNFINLEKLALNNNAIEDINCLEKVNFKNLRELWLYNNNITDINIFTKVKFFNLEILSLSNNNRY